MSELSLLADMAIVLVAALFGGMIEHRLKLPVIVGYLLVGIAEMVRFELEAGLEIIRHTLHRFGLTTQEIQYIVNALREEGV